eukprot:1054769-Pyramimonas_sp.AAC.1
MRLLHWERSVDGHYKTGKRNKREAFSRIMVVEVYFGQTYAHFGSEVRACAVRLRRDTAKASKGSKEAHKTWWPRLAAILQENK